MIYYVSLRRKKGCFVMKNKWCFCVFVFLPFRCCFNFVVLFTFFTIERFTSYDFLFFDVIF